ncbi:hypothetical protein V1264_020099 [Littorina saxatilis]|uniref:Fibronectin type-III domain-containing protein n=1 Tax=Littorina saxatilis TaxID=31220 RepID=A0AAN9BBW1_9CAEN
MGFYQRVAVLSYLLLLLCHAAPIERASPKPEWHPIISTAQYSPTKSLVVTVSPRVNSIYYLRVCVSLTLRCEGNVTTMESPNDTFRYSVTGLHVNKSYYVYVKPFDEYGHELDTWIHKQSPIKIEPWPEDPPKEADHVDASGITEVLVALLLVLLIAVVGIVCLCKKGYLHKIKFLRCCLPQSSLVGQPIKVLQMYVVENEPFQQVVQKHMAFLKKYLNVDPKDANEMRHQQNQDQWLENACSERRVIVYISPQLMHMLRNNEGQGQCGEEVAHPHPLARKYAQMIHRLTSADALKKGRGKGRNPVFILSGCFPSDPEDEKYVNQQINMRTLQRHWVSKFGTLTSPAPLLSKLSGCHHSFFSTRDWASCHQARELLPAVSHMYGLTTHNHYYVDLNGVEPNNPVQDESDSDQTEHEHHYSSVGWGDRPRRTDSGFSSSTMEVIRYSNHSSEGNSSPGVTGGDKCMELDSHAETDPMLQSTSLSVSQIISFTPPDLVEADENDSCVIDAELMKVNSAGESRWSPRANC